MSDLAHAPGKPEYAITHADVAGAEVRGRAWVV